MNKRLAKYLCLLAAQLVAVVAWPASLTVGPASCAVSYSIGADPASPGRIVGGYTVSGPPGTRWTVTGPQGAIFASGWGNPPYTLPLSGVMQYSGYLPGDPTLCHIAPNTTASIIFNVENYGSQSLQIYNGQMTKLPIKLHNPMQTPTTFKVYSGTELVREVTLPPGASITYNENVPYNGNMTITQTTNGLSRDGFGNLYLNPSGNITSGPLMLQHPGPDGSMIYSDNLPLIPADSPDDPEPATVWASIVPSQPLVPASQVATSPTGGDGGYKPIWTNPTTVAGYNASTDLLTNSVFREGVQNLINRDNLSESEKMAKRANDANAANAELDSDTAAQSAALLRRSVKTLRRLIQTGTLHAFKIGGRWFLQPSEINAFIHRQLAHSNPRPPC